MSEDFTYIDPAVPIRLDDGEDVDVPLWSNQHGLLFSDRTELVAFGVSSGLAAAIEDWAERNPSRTVRGGPLVPWSPAEQQDRDVEGRALARRLQDELGDRYTVVYVPMNHVWGALDPGAAPDDGAPGACGG